MGYDRHIARARLRKQGADVFRQALFVLLCVSVVLWPLPGMVAQASHHGDAIHYSASSGPAPSHDMTTHAHAGTLEQVAAIDQQELCADGCRCAGQMMVHCCSQPVPSAAPADEFVPPEMARVSEQHELLMVDEESGTILPPTPPPKHFYT